MNNKKYSLHNLLKDNRFVLVLSVFLAVIFWATVCISLSPETQVVIENVPVKIEMENSVPSQYGLRMFGENTYTVDITVSGSKYIVGGRSVSADDFNVTASTSLVTSSGTHSLPVKVSKTTDADFTIDDYSVSYISVYFDEYIETQANVNIKIEGESITQGDYIAGEDYITDRKTVLVGGPALEISRLDRVNATVSVDKTLKESTAFKASLSAVDKNSNELNFITFDGESNATMTVTIPVYKKVVLPVKVGFTNSPANYVTKPLAYSVSPENVEVAVLQNGSQGNELKVTDVDFSYLKAGENTFKINLAQIDGVILLEDSPKTVNVYVSVENTSSRQFDIDSNNISVSNAPIDRSINFTSSGIKGVTVYGDENELASLNADDVKARVDFSNLEVIDGKNTVTLPLYIKSVQGCWIYGEYTISFTSKKIS